jgi:hypothetical protein
VEFRNKAEKRVIPARTTPEYEYTVVKLSGPCLICEREMEYAKNWPTDEEHARKQFDPKRRNRLIAKLRADERDDNVPKVETIEGMVCPGCLPESRRLRAEANRKHQEAYERAQATRTEHDRRVAENQRARQRHYEWRKATAKEVARLEPFSAEFRASFGGSKKVYRILFRWSAAAGQCRGDAYLMRVGMWVDGKLTAHYHGWNLEDFETPDDEPVYHFSEENWPTQDVFAPGFCRWIEREFQPLLLKLKPDTVWKPGGYSDLDTQVRRPSTLLVRWLDGSGYVHLLPALDVPDVIDWAYRNLRLSVEKRVYQRMGRDLDTI